MSVGAGYSSSLNSAVDAAVAANVAQIVAAGNDNKNACNYSPASAASAITVGATDITDTRASYSNYGSCLDLFGPGTDITSAYIGAPDLYAKLSGTSMATPNVCGVAAKYLSEDPSRTASQINSKLINDATTNVVKNAGSGSPNRIAYGYCLA